MAREKGALLVLLIALVQGSDGQCFSNPVGVADENVIRDGQFMATNYLADNPPHFGRLNHIAAWCSSTYTRNEYLEVDLGDIFDICGFATQGSSSSFYASRFEVAFSNDGLSWYIYHDNDGDIMVFNKEQDGSQTEEHQLLIALTARHIRFYTTNYIGRNCLKVEVYGSKVGEYCYTSPVGVAYQNVIPDAQLTASSYLEAYPPYYGRLNHQLSWCSLTRNQNEYLQVDLGDTFDICGVATQGFDGLNYASSFKLGYSTDGSSWDLYRGDNGNVMVFKKIKDGSQTEEHYLFTPPRARHIRFILTNFAGHNCLKVEVYSYRIRSGRNCYSNPVGVTNQNIIPDAQFTASSYLEDFPPYYGRVNHQLSWCSLTQYPDEYLQIDLGDTFDICGFITQGFSSLNYASSVVLGYSTDDSLWHVYEEDNGSVMVFNKEQDGSEIEEHELPILRSVAARYIRFYTTNFVSHNCLKVEVYGTRVQ